MTSAARLHYERASAYLGSLYSCLSAMEQCGVDEPWSSALRADAARLARSLQAAVDDIERRADTSPRGWTVPQHRPRTAPDVWAEYAEAVAATSRPATSRPCPPATQHRQNRRQTPATVPISRQAVRRRRARQLAGGQV